VTFRARTSELDLNAEVPSGQVAVGCYDCEQRKELASQPDVE
jgi:hypothetical protein